MIQRLIDFYQRTHAGSESMTSAIWLGVLKLYEPFCTALRNGDHKGVEVFLETAGPANKLYGLECGKLYTFSDSMCFPYVQKLANLAGVLNYFQPNQQSPSNHWKIKDVNATIKAIEAELGFELRVPSCFGFTGDGIPLRFIMYHCGAALALRRLLCGQAPRHVLEIGAGCGNFGYIASRCGSQSYTVIDLPHIAVISAWFMSKVVGADKVWLNGEPESESAFARFYSCTDFSPVRSQGFDLILNCDSLPEMTVPVQDDYINLIRTTLVHCGHFLSVNHEGDQAGQMSVLSAVKRNGRLKLLSRTPFPMMDGYVQEIYQP